MTSLAGNDTLAPACSLPIRAWSCILKMIIGEVQASDVHMMHTCTTAAGINMTRRSECDGNLQVASAGAIKYTYWKQTSPTRSATGKKKDWSQRGSVVRSMTRVQALRVVPEGHIQHMRDHISSDHPSEAAGSVVPPIPLVSGVKYGGHQGAARYGSAGSLTHFN